jgi:phosphonopyruvate decarboxylase
MINSNQLLNLFKKKKISLFCGVPDSVLKYFSSALEGTENHFICTNEGSAVSLAIGTYLTTGNLGLVYMQNSGFANAINPLISIAEKTVYSIPLVLLVGWRGSPGIDDEPQHVAKGKITTKLLDNLNIKYHVIKEKKDFQKISNLINLSKKKKVPVALLCKPGVLLDGNIKINTNSRIHKNNENLPRREDVILKILENVNNNDKIISTTGYTSRELFQLRKTHKKSKGKDFYMVGGMGHSSMVALGVSLKSKNNVICLDGDGSLLMHMGALATIGVFGKKNFKYILLNNSAHESVGGQKTVADRIDFFLLSKSLGFKSYVLIKNKNNHDKTIAKFLNSCGPSFLEIKIQVKSMQNLSRPSNFKIIKNKFMSLKNDYTK